jgi:hypothetical protein
MGDHTRPDAVLEAMDRLIALLDNASMKAFTDERLYRSGQRLKTQLDSGLIVADVEREK